MKLSQTQLDMLDTMIDNLFYYYSNPDEKPIEEPIYNESYINIMFDAWKKINDSLSRRTRPYNHRDKQWYETRKNDCRETSRDKILELNNKNIVKTDFYDLHHFNSWEKIRTFIKPKSQEEINDEKFDKLLQEFYMLNSKSVKPMTYKDFLIDKNRQQINK